MFVLTVEGVEVWTFPPDKMPAARGKAESWLDEHAIGGAGTPRYSSPDPSPRPCLLHVQQLEVSGFEVGRFRASSAWQHLTVLRNQYERSIAVGGWLPLGVMRRLVIANILVWLTLPVATTFDTQQQYRRLTIAMHFRF